jgi:hypothetical protein
VSARNTVIGEGKYYFLSLTELRMTTLLGRKREEKLGAYMTLFIKITLNSTFIFTSL